ncbi:MAG: hypothetical protein FVQ83_03830 [Chloroflexi bacterium]|nr:hypothetical protein [Chloroflexota bacterium]
MLASKTPQVDYEDCCTPVINQELDKSSVSVMCSECSTKGKSIDTQTVKSLLAVSLENVHPVEYHFCAEDSCPVVYFAVDGGQVFYESDLRERVYQKAAGDESVNVCSCFDITPADIHNEYVETGSSTVVDRVDAGVKAGQCACEIRNPQGSCCLGNVRSLVKKMTVETALQES